MAGGKDTALHHPADTRCCIRVVVARFLLRWCCGIFLCCWRVISIIAGRIDVGWIRMALEFFLRPQDLNRIVHDVARRIRFRIIRLPFLHVSEPGFNPRETVIEDHFFVFANGSYGDELQEKGAFERLGDRHVMNGIDPL